MSVQILSHPELKLDEPSHTYTLNGIAFPSVTQVIDRAGLADYSMIPEDKRSYYLARGKAAHEAVHYWLEDDLDESSLSEDTLGCLNSARKFLEHSDFIPEPGMFERMVFNQAYGFCGRLDVVGRFPQLGLCIVDWKRSLLGAADVQTAAYLLCVPRVFHRAALQLHPDGKMATPHFFPPRTLLSDQRRFRDALAALRQFDAKGPLEHDPIYR